MMEIELSEIINSPGLWLASSVIVVVMLAQSFLFFQAGKKEADRLGIPKQAQLNGIRSAMLTAVGPALALVVVLISMITIVGAPTTWMRLNDIGAGRTELSVISIAAGQAGATAGGEGWTAGAFSMALWGMALNNFGWLFFTMIATKGLAAGINKMNEKFNPQFITALMGGLGFGVFGYLVMNNIYGKANIQYYIIACLVAALSMLCLNKLFRRYPRMMELSLGITMLIGMFTATGIRYIITGA